jgi:chloramphenicol 3-O phosphotransferase
MITLFNRPGSAGKTAIAKAIQHESPDLWLTFGIDTFIDMIPADRHDACFTMIPGQNQRGPTMHVASGPEGENLFGVMPKFAEMLASRGHNLMIDEVLLDQEALKAYAQHLRAYTVYYIGIVCDLAVMQGRERLRGDRCIGLSNDQMDRVHHGVLGVYDFTVDTTVICPVESARRILQFVDDVPVPRAFKSLGFLG